jgi:hypothetical protein
MVPVGPLRSHAPAKAACEKRQLPTLDEFYNSSDRFWDGWSRSPVNPLSPAGYDPVQLPDLERLIGRLIGPNTGHPVDLKFPYLIGDFLPCIHAEAPAPWLRLAVAFLCAATGMHGRIDRNHA